MDTLISGLVDSVVVALLHAAEVANLSGAHVIFTAVSISRHTLRNCALSCYAKLLSSVSVCSAVSVTVLSTSCLNI